MSITLGERLVIERNRRVYFNSRDGREALRSALTAAGILETPERWMQMLDFPERNMPTLIQGFELLADCGVLIEDNFDALIKKMAELPLPQVQEIEHGETSGT